MTGTAAPTRPTPTPPEPDPLVQAYRYLQRIVGLIALALPFVVAIGDRVLAGQGLRGSISAYYYGATGSWFVGSLCALAVFFLSYEYRKPPRRGYEPDRVASNALSAFAIGVALLPTAREGADATGGAAVVGTLHLVCAGLLFVLLAYFSLCRFTRTAADPPELSIVDEWRRALGSSVARELSMTPAKRRRNAIYRACGWVIVGCIAMVGVANLLHWPLLFWLETIAILAFGTSWLVKSGSITALED